jgi:hypothetical protein
MKTRPQIVFAFTFALLVTVLPAQNAAAQGSFWDFASSYFGTAQKPAASSSSAALSALSQSDVQAALREALSLSAEKVVKQVSREGGFSLDPKIRIPLPPALQPVDQALKAVGMGALTEDLQMRINKAAEAAAPKAKEIFVSAIKKMTIDDAKQILNGPEDAATAYLKKHMSPEMLTAMQPMVSSALAEAGAVKAYDAVLGQYKQAMPFMPDAKANLSQYATQKAIDGIFYYVAQEEAAIRKDPAKRTTDLIKKVFSAAK